MMKSNVDNATDDARELDLQALSEVNGGVMPQKSRPLVSKKPFSKREWYEEQQRSNTPSDAQ